MQVRVIKFAALLFTNAAALALSNALPVQSFPQWITLNGEDGGQLVYNFNSLKALPNDIKQIDTYNPKLKLAVVVYISCPRWRYAFERDAVGWRILQPESLIEELSYRLCGKS